MAGLLTASNHTRERAHKCILPIIRKRQKTHTVFACSSNKHSNTIECTRLQTDHTLFSLELLLCFLKLLQMLILGSHSSAGPLGCPRNTRPGLALGTRALRAATIDLLQRLLVLGVPSLLLTGSGLLQLNSLPQVLLPGRSCGLETKALSSLGLPDYKRVRRKHKTNERLLKVVEIHDIQVKMKSQL